LGLGLETGDGEHSKTTVLDLDELLARHVFLACSRERERWGERERWVGGRDMERGREGERDVSMCQRKEIAGASATSIAAPLLLSYPISRSRSSSSADRIG
jgi:hypothetical protein